MAEKTIDQLRKLVRDRPDWTVRRYAAALGVSPARVHQLLIRLGAHHVWVLGSYYEEFLRIRNELDMANVLIETYERYMWRQCLKMCRNGRHISGCPVVEFKLREPEGCECVWDEGTWYVCDAHRQWGFAPDDEPHPDESQAEVDT